MMKNEVMRNGMVGRSRCAMGWIRKGEKHGALLHKNDSEDSPRAGSSSHGYPRLEGVGQREREGEGDRGCMSRGGAVWVVGSLTVGSLTGAVEMDVHRVISASIEPASGEERPPRGVDCCVVGRWWPLPEKAGMCP